MRRLIVEVVDSVQVGDAGGDTWLSHFDKARTVNFHPSLNPTIYKLKYTKNTPKLGIHNFLKKLYNDLVLYPKLTIISCPFIIC